MQVQNFYLHAMMDNKLKQFVLSTPKPERAFIQSADGSSMPKSGKHNKFRERSCFHKVARVIYKFTRMVYVGYIFYFVPYTTLFLQFASSVGSEEIMEEI